MPGNCLVTLIEQILNLEIDIGGCLPEIQFQSGHNIIKHISGQINGIIGCNIPFTGIIGDPEQIQIPVCDMDGTVSLVFRNVHQLFNIILIRLGS